MTEAELGHSCTFGFVVGGKSAIGVDLDDGGGFLEKTVAVKGGVARCPNSVIYPAITARKSNNSHGVIAKVWKYQVLLVTRIPAQFYE
ncbi:hypothetical protein [Xenorhabdus bovienii]|uniref:hypothetical protein n=1 Tax=Xenorhabdus bovienii TaxID=40576 RepID=UPI00237C681F|nr:hypothetical protein [Xenorhabdus bovienii]